MSEEMTVMAPTPPLRPAGLALMAFPFEKHLISLLPKPYKKDSPKSDCTVCGKYHGQPAVHLEYVGHAALTSRLLECDPNWNWEPLAKDAGGLPMFDKSGGLWIKLTVCGVTRLGYGHADNSDYKDSGAREKEVIGDALRNAGMRFGAALELWHKGDLHNTKAENGTAPKKPHPQAAGPKQRTAASPKPKPENEQHPAKTPIADASAEPPPRNETPITMAEASILYAKLSDKRGFNKRAVDERVKELWGVESAMKLKRWQYDKIISETGSK